MHDRRMRQRRAGGLAVRVKAVDMAVRIVGADTITITTTIQCAIAITTPSTIIVTGAVNVVVVRCLKHISIAWEREYRGRGCIACVSMYTICVRLYITYVRMSITSG